MSCPSHRDSIVLLVDGELSEDASAGVRTHLAGCEECRAFSGELERLKARLTPADGAVTAMDEARFWRKFEADLAVRVARGETPWWRRAVTIPVPAMGALVAVVVVTGGIAGHAHRQARELEARTARLTALLHDAAESHVVPVSVARAQAAAAEEAPVRTVDLGGVPEGAMSAAAAPASAAARALPASTIRVRPARAFKRENANNIRFVDSDGVLQAADLY
ncbi:MAG TPA: anti-sigma factor [bacterium]|nr:anti-sigma factor [bacterium]